MLLLCYYYFYHFSTMTTPEKVSAHIEHACACGTVQGEPGLEFRILCLEDSVISIISPSSGGSPGPV